MMEYEILEIKKYLEKINGNIIFGLFDSLLILFIIGGFLGALVLTFS